MKLMDFKAFDPFNRARQKMAAEHYGFFELFDPERHLSGEERSILARKGLSVSHSKLGRLLDFTLVYKNSRVVMMDRHCFHVANCDQLPIASSAQIATSFRAIGASSAICRECLQLLSFQGYDEQKARKAGYNRSVLEKFRLDAFWREYPPYPLKLGRELVKPLEYPRPPPNTESDMAGMVAVKED